MADTAQLVVGLQLNDTNFKNKLTAAYRTAGEQSAKFNRQAQQDAKKTDESYQRIGGTLGGLAGKLAGLAGVELSLQGLAATSRQYGQALTELASITVAATAQMKQLDDAARQASSASGEGGSRAEEMLKLAGGLNDSAAAWRDQAAAARGAAQEIARFYTVKDQENQFYGLSASNLKEFVDVYRQVRDASLAEAGAKEKVTQVSRMVLAADIAEAQGKTKLISSLNQITEANKEVSFTARVASVGTNLLRSGLMLLGGPIGLGITATVEGVKALYNAFQNAEVETKGFNAALQTGGLQAILTSNDLKRLADQLGGGASAIKGVQTAASAGFSGELLTQMSDLARQIDESGGSADQLVNKIASLRDDPLQAIGQLTQQGILLNEATVQQIASLQRQGQEVAAGDLAQRAATEEAKKGLDEQTRKTNEQSNALKNMALQWYATSIAATDASMSVQAPLQEKQMEDLQQQRQQQMKEDEKKQRELQQRTLETLRVENSITAAMKAGADSKKEASKLIAEINRRHDVGEMSPEEYAQALRGVNKLFSGQKTKAYVDDEGSRRLQQLREQSAVLRTQAQNTDKLTESQKKLAVFEQEIAGLHGKKLTSGQKSLLPMQEQIRAQLIENIALEKSNHEREVGKKLLEQTHNLVQESAAKQLEYSNRNAQMTLSPEAYEQMVAEQQIRESFHQRRLQLDKEVADKNSEQYVQQADILASEQQRQLDIVRDAEEKKSAIKGDYVAGLKKGLLDWSGDAGNVFGQVKSITTQTFEGMASALTNFVTVGKASFGDFAKSILTDLTGMMIKMAMFNALKTGMSFFLPTGNDPGPVPMFLNAKGGVYASPSLSAFSGQIVSNPTLFAFARGAGLMGEAGPEAIMPLKRGADGSLGVRAIGAGQQPAAAPNVYITIENGGNVSSQADPGWGEFGKQMGNIAAQESQKVINRNLMPGQPIWKAIKGM